MQTLNHALDPETLARIARLELIARQAVEGFLAGKHPSPHHGSSVEYADHRPYALGDPIRTIDWKLLAKTDKYYIKLFEEQTNLRATILLDASRSMAFGEGSGTKFHQSCVLAAALAYLMIRQNDLVGLALVDQEIRDYLPAGGKPSHFRRIVELMVATHPRGTTLLGSVIHLMAERMRRRGLVIIISDLLDEPGQIAEGLAHLRYRQHEAIVFHVVDPDELTFPYERMTRFKDPEGASTVITNPRMMRKRYLRRLDDHFDQVKRSCSACGVSYERVGTDGPCDRMLGTYLEKRARMRRTAGFHWR